MIRQTIQNRLRCDWPRSVNPPLAVVANKARQLKEQGKDVISLGEGELDFPTPEHISKAGMAAIQHGDTRYTAVAGTTELKKAIQAKFRRENNLDYALDQITAGTGAKQLIFNAMMATLSPGDEVVIPVPSWVSYVDMVNLCGGEPKLIECDEASGFKLVADELENALSSDTKWLILNSPNNPTGAVYSREELASLAEVLARYPRTLVLCDDIYEHIIYDGQFSTMAEVAPVLADRVLTLNGVSKVFSMTGWRLGYGAGPSWLIKAMNVIQSQSTTNATSISQAAAACALSGSLDFFEPRLAALVNRRDQIVSAVNATDCLTTEAPPGAFYVFVNCAGMIGKMTPSGTEIKTDSDAAEYFLDQAELAIVPGAAFNMSPYLRIAFAIADDRLTVACERLQSACSKLS